MVSVAAPRGYVSGIRVLVTITGDNGAMNSIPSQFDQEAAAAMLNEMAAADPAEAPATAESLAETLAAALEDVGSNPVNPAGEAAVGDGESSSEPV